MKKFGQLVVLRSSEQWQQYKDELRENFRDKPAHKTTPIEFPTEPRSYPCLAAALPRVADITQPGELARVDIYCCFVYPKDAERLLGVGSQSQSQGQSQGQSQSQGQVERYTPISDILADDDDYLDDDFGPSEIGTLVLALTLELRSLGAIKSDRLISTIHKVREWLEDNIEENLEDDDTITILEKLWRAHDAG